MPSSAPRPCRYAGCTALVQRGTLCAEHRPDADGADSHRPNSRKRGYGQQHQRWRKMVLARHPFCQWPGCREFSTVADHIVPLAEGGGWSLENGQGLCARHHGVKTVEQDGGFGRRRIARHGS